MNWDDLRIFLAVARSRQILAAATRLGLNHATVGRRITALEEALQSQLLIRRTTGCELTPQGEALFETAERVEAEMLSAQGALGRRDAAIAGTVRVGAPDGFGVVFLAPRLGALTARHPDLVVQLVPVPRSFSLSRREADIAITVQRPEQGRVVARRLVDYTLGLYASADYLAAHGAPEAVEDLARHRLVGHVEDLVYAPTLNYAAEITRSWQASFEVSSAIGQAQAVRAGAGIAILHDYIARSCPELVPVLPELRVRRAYWLVIHEAMRDLVRVRAVSEFIGDAVQAERAIFT